MNVVETLNVAINLENDEINKEKANGQFVLQKIPKQISKADLLFNEVVDEYLLLSKADKEDIKKLITTEMAWYLLGFGERMATYSLRLSSQKYFTNGLLAIGMTLGTLDKREILLILPLYYDVLNKIGLSLDVVTKQNNEFTTVLKEFLDREEKDKNLECMGYILKYDENNNLVYHRTW